jgi:alkanesulfonate monooxygenase SsuD/methylene tetrahydromethanopterin reductase-like flavin-dependent oxidoreductase (luciferase family)
MIGGNGPNVTWRLAAKHADELNLDGMSPSDVAAALPIIHSRCEEIGRDPATLAISVHMWGEDLLQAGRPRVDRLAGYRELGVSRVMGLDRAIAKSDEALESFAEDARAAGIEMAAG